MNAKKFSPLAKRVLALLEAQHVDHKEADEILRLVMQAEVHRDQLEDDELLAKEKEVTAEFYANYKAEHYEHGPTGFGTYYENDEVEDRVAAREAEKAKTKKT